MKKERTTLKISTLEANNGQIPWLPTNPRQWTQTDIDKTRDSVLRDPDFLEDRPLLVIPLEEKKWVVFAGNLRREGAKAGKIKEVPAVIYYPETEEDRETIKRRAILDNGSFGSWDYDTLANEWDDLPLTEWGVPAWKEEGINPEDYGEQFNLPDGEGPASNQITFYFSVEQKELIETALDQAEEGEDNFGNDNKTGNKLYQIVKEWLASRT